MFQLLITHYTIQRYIFFIKLTLRLLPMKYEYYHIIKEELA